MSMGNNGIAMISTYAKELATHTGSCEVHRLLILFFGYFIIKDIPPVLSGLLQDL